MSTIKILLADDHPIILQGLKQIIEEEPDMKVTAVAKNGNEALEHLRREKFNIAVLDITMPKKTGIEVLEYFKVYKIKTPVLILSVHPEDQYAIRLIKSGASGYMTKESAPDELVSAIRKICSGGKYISHTLAESLLINENNNKNENLHNKLSNREFQILCQLAQGKTVKEISAELNLNIKTVSTYKQRVLEKMKMNSNSQITRYALVHKLI